MPENATAPVYLLKWDGSPARTIQDAVWKLEDRDDSTNRLSVTTSLAEADGVESEQELVFKGRRFSVAEVDRDRDQDRAVVHADEVQAELADLWLVEFVANSWTLEQATEAALSGTRWTLGQINGIRFGRANFEDISRLDALKFLARHQDARLSFDSLRRRVNITATAGTVHETVFTYGRQLTNIEKQESAPTLTTLYPSGADGMSVAMAKRDDGSFYYSEVVEDYGYYTAKGLSLAEARARFKKEEYWEDSRYEVKENLLRDAQKRLAVEAYPQISYTLTAAVTYSADDGTPEVDDFGISELRLGDQVYVWDEEIDTKLRAEVTAITTSSDSSENQVTLAYLPDSLGSSVEGSYFGDSGSVSNGDRGRSGFQPRPSMPILETVTSVGSGLVRWNGQDHDGNYDTIPARFGSIETVVAKLEADGSIPSPDSDDAFGGTRIDTRGGGVSSIGFGGAGDFAVWFYMLGRDAQTRSEYSEPLVVEVTALVDTSAIQDELDYASGRLDDMDDHMAGYDTNIQLALDGADSARMTAEDLRDNTLPALDARLGANEIALVETEGDLASSRLDIENLRDVTLPNLDDQLTGAIQDVDDRYATLAITDGTDLFADPAVFLTGEFREGMWNSTRNNFQINGGTSLTGTRAEYLLGATPNNTLRFSSPIDGPSTDPGWFEHEAGQEYRVDYMYRVLGGGTEIGSDAQLGAVLFEWTESIAPGSPGGYVTGARIYRDEADNSNGGSASLGVFHRGSVVVDNVPANAGRIRFVLSTGASLDVPSGALIQYSKFTVRRMNAGRLLVDGSIRARHIVAEEIAAAIGQFLYLEAGQINTQDIAAAVANVIELNASQITSGKISTSRLEAEEVAAAVGQFLTLDAMEINVEELAGDIANIIQVTSESIMAGAIQTRHLAISNSENLVPEDWHGAAAAGVYTYNPNGSFADGSSSAFLADPAPVSSGWASTIHPHGRRGWTTSATATAGSLAFRAGPGKGIPVTPGEKYAIQTWVRDFGDGGVLAWHINFYSKDGSQGSTGPEAIILDLKGITHGEFDDEGVTHEFTVPNLGYQGGMYMVPFLRQEASVSGSSSTVMEPKIRKMVGGELLVDGSILTRHLTVTEDMTAALGQFLRIEAGSLASNEIESMSIIGGTVEGATLRGNLIETHSANNRGVKLDNSGIRAWDSGGNMRFNLSASTGNLTAVGTFRTSFSGNQIEMYDDGDGGNIRFYGGNDRGSIKVRQSVGRLSMVYGNMGSSVNEGDLPFVGVEQTRALLGFRSQRITVGGTTASNQYMELDAGGGSINVRGTLDMLTSGRTRYRWGGSGQSSLGWVGQRPEAPGARMEIRADVGPVQVSASGLMAFCVYDTTTSSSANVRVTSSGELQRVSSASRYKLDQQELSVPDSILDVPLEDWVDKAAKDALDKAADMPRPLQMDDQYEVDAVALDVRRTPGVIAEKVEALGGSQFVLYGADGQTEEVMYDRLSLAQIQVLKRNAEADRDHWKSKYEVLEARIAALEGAA